MDVTGRARFEIDLDGQMPDGLPLVQVETDEATILSVADGEMTPELAHVLNENLAEALWPVTAQFQLFAPAQMPGGARFALKKVSGTTVLAVRKGEMKQTLLASLNRHLARCAWAADEAGAAEVSDSATPVRAR